MRVALAITYMFLVVLSSCNKVIPSGFWKNFETEYLKENISDQGPRGGHRAMHWKATQGYFKPSVIVDYADKNGWQLVDSMDIQAEVLSTWIWDSKPIFPLSHTGFSAMSFNITTYKNFPRWINTRAKLFFFKTGWLAYEPGTDEANEINGFVLLNTDESEMSVYHLWGE